MTNDRELLQQALDALESDCGATKFGASETLRARLAQPEPEPVAWGFQNTGITGSNRWMYLRETIPAEDQYRGVLWTPLYTAPPQREWQGLTKEELQEISDFHFHGAFSARDIYEDIEAKLKEKNT